MEKSDNIRIEFLGELCESLKKVNNEVQTTGEHELMSNLVKTLKDTIELELLKDDGTVWVYEF